MQAKYKKEFNFLIFTSEKNFNAINRYFLGQGFGFTTDVDYQHFFLPFILAPVKAK